MEGLCKSSLQAPLLAPVSDATILICVCRPFELELVYAEVLGDVFYDIWGTGF